MGQNYGFLTLTKLTKSMLRILVVLVLASSAGYLAKAQKMLFVGMYDVKGSNKIYWCLDGSFEQQTIETLGEYEVLRKQFYLKYKGLSPSTKLVKSDESIIIYEYDTYWPGFKCTKRVVSFVVGKSRLDARFKMDNLEKKKDWVSQPSEIFTWSGESQYETIIEDYNGVRVKFILGKAAGGKEVIALQFKNTHREKAAVIVYKPSDSDQVETVVLQPGGTLTRSARTGTGIDMQVNYTDKTKTSPEAIQKLRDFIGNTLMIKDGKFQKSEKKITTCMCVRG